MSMLLLATTTMWLKRRKMKCKSMTNNPLKSVKTLQRKKRSFGLLPTLGNAAANKSRSIGHVGTSPSDPGVHGAISAEDAASRTKNGQDPQSPL